MARTQDPVFHHGKLLVDSSGLDPTMRPKYDYILQEMAKADGISLLHKNLRDGTHDRLLIAEPQCFDFAFPIDVSLRLDMAIANFDLLELQLQVMALWGYRNYKALCSVAPQL